MLSVHCFSNMAASMSLHSFSPLRFSLQLTPEPRSPYPLLPLVVLCRHH